MAGGTSWDFLGDLGDCKLADLPELTDGRQLKLRTGDFVECNVSGILWTGAISLSRWLLRADVMRGKAVLELGAGTGACGLYAAALGARRVTLTDGGSSYGLASLATARANVQANQELWSTETEVTVVPYAWGEPFSEELSGYDYIIGSDVTAYSEAAHADLCCSLAEQLRKRSRGCRAVLSHFHRTHGHHAAADEAGRDGTFDKFVTTAAAAGLTVRVFQEDEMLGERRVSLIEVFDSQA